MAAVGELTPDPLATQAFEAVEERDRLDRLHTALERALATLPLDLQTVVRDRYYGGKTVNTKAHNAALHLLRAPKCSRGLRGYLL